MQTINNIELKDETIYPNEGVLKTILGESFAAYCELLKLYDSNEMNYTWKYYKDGKAWLCKITFRKKCVQPLG